VVSELRGAKNERFPLTLTVALRTG